MFLVKCLNIERMLIGFLYIDCLRLCVLCICLFWFEVKIEMGCVCGMLESIVFNVMNLVMLLWSVMLMNFVVNDC